ncbi:MAG: hypothetical protein DI629_05610 [Mesorhizobium amorphae]|nr:MAG: hypothetical protein DI629_05610 [Mesorhizobium amorphae]
MSTRYTLAAAAHARQDIKKSRFVAAADAVDDEEAAKRFIALHSDATASHNCWAWRVGYAYRFNDDGEPGGTAGKPILQAIDGQALDHVAVVVTRWFGGVLLGSGGLVRAYGGTAALCLREAEKTALVDMVSATMRCQFGDLALLQARLTALPNVKLLGSTFNETGAEWSLSVSRDEAESLVQLVSDLSSGRAELRLNA